MIDFKGKKVGVISLGCDKNRVDSERALAVFKKLGLELTNEADKAQIILVNTCAFLESARKEAVETILSFAAYKNENLEKLIVSGCLPQKYITELFDSLPEVDVFLGFKDYDYLGEALRLAYLGKRVNYVNKSFTLNEKERVVTTPLHYAYLKIADGCDNFCTYCLIPKIRGKYVSEPMEKIISEAENLGDISELILVAQDVTLYGVDLYGKKTLPELIERLSRLENIKKIRILYAYPEHIDDDLIKIIAKNEKVIKYLDIPLQHADDSVLKKMNRKGTGKEYLSLFEKLRNKINGIALRSTFIAGFPQESEENFLNLCNFLKKAKLESAGFFAYSREEDTAAYKLTGQISEKEKKRRVKILYSVQKEIVEEHNLSMVGKTLKILCDGIDYDKNLFVGRPYFFAPDIDGKVYFTSDKIPVQGSEIYVKIKKYKNYDLFGEQI